MQLREAIGEPAFTAFVAKDDDGKTIAFISGEIRKIFYRYQKSKRLAISALLMFCRNTAGRG